MARERNLVLGKYDIGEWRYKELKAFCRQYPEKKAKAAALLGVQGGSRVEEYRNSRGMIEGTVTPSGKGTTSDTVLKAVEKREELLHDVQMIDECAKAVNGGLYANALILNICYGSPFETLEQSIMPSSNRNSYFDARRKFFALLDLRMQETKRNGHRDMVQFGGYN